MKRIISTALVAFIFLSACQKEENQTIESEENYMLFSAGSYWVYETIQLDSDGNQINDAIIDSIYIAGDTLINNQQYRLFKGTNYPWNNPTETVLIARDSSGYTVTPDGNIIFSSKNFSDILAHRSEIIDNDTLYSVSYMMQKTDDLITVPAGTFKVLDYIGEVVTNHEIPNSTFPKYCHNYYADGVGKVKSVHHFLVSSNYIEKRLLRYKIVR